MIHRFILHNDDVLAAGDTVLAAGQVGLLSGWGVFSTLRVAEGTLFAFERHWARMERDAALFHVTLPADREHVRRKLLELVEANHAPNATMRVVVARNGGGVWEGPPTGRASDLIALTADLKAWGEGVRLCCQPQARHAACMFAGTKILSWSLNLTWLEDAQARGFDEVILLNERGEVSECTSANIFIANGNQVWTPPLASGCLPGITREILLSEIHVPGVALGEKTLFPADLEKADEVFITSTTRALLPVLQIEGHAIRRAEKPRQPLQDAYERYVAQYVASQKVPVA